MPYVCDRCCLLCSDFNMLKVHMRKHTNEKPFSCPFCSRQFAQKGNLKTHMSVHDSNKKFVCNECNKQFSQKKSQEKHQSKCWMFNAEKNLTEIRRASCKNSAAAPDIIPGLATTSDHFDANMEILEILPNMESSKNKLSCQKNIKFFLSNDSKSVSASKNSNGKQSQKTVFICEKCDMVFKSKTKLMLHIFIHDGKAPRLFICHVCEKGFTHRGSMNAHIRFIHKGERPFPCSTCSKRFSKKCHLEIHLRTHTKEKPFKCDLCKKTFSRSEHLRYHLKTHKTDMIFGCSLCNASFNNAALLRKHNKLHRDENDRENFPLKNKCKLQIEKPDPTILSASELGTKACIIPADIEIVLSKAECNNQDSINKEELIKNIMHHDLSAHRLINVICSNAKPLNDGLDTIVCQNLISKSAHVTRPLVLHPLNTFRFEQLHTSYSLNARNMKTCSCFTHFPSPTETASAFSSTLAFTNNYSPPLNTIIPYVNAATNNQREKMPFPMSLLSRFSIPTSNIDFMSCSSSISVTSVLLDSQASCSLPNLENGTHVLSNHLHRCTEYNKSFSSPHHIFNHHRVHSGEKCSSCFTQGGSLKFHTSTSHLGERKRGCSICSASFSGASHPKRCLITHSQEKPYGQIRKTEFPGKSEAGHQSYHTTQVVAFNCSRGRSKGRGIKKAEDKNNNESTEMLNESVKSFGGQSSPTNASAIQNEAGATKEVFKSLSILKSHSIMHSDLKPF